MAAWRHGIVTGFLALIVATAFWFESATGYCRRCTHFNCGPHGSVMHRFFRRDPSPLPRARLVLHAVLDLVMGIGGAVLIASAWPALLIPIIVWLFGAAWSVLPRSPEALRDTAKWGRAVPVNRSIGRD